MPDGCATLARRICVEPVKWPRPRTVCMMSVAIFVLGILRVCFLPDFKRIERQKAAAAEAFPDLELIKLVQAEELAGIRELMESEERDMEAFKKKQEQASLEWANLAEVLSGYAAELEEIGSLAQTVAQDYAGDVDLSTEAVQAQANLESFQRSVMESMEMFKMQLDQQEATLRKVNKEYSEVGEQATADAYKEVETKVADALKELALFRSVTESNLSELETEINGLLTAEDLEELLNEKAVFDRPRSSSALQPPVEDLYRLVEAEIDRLVGQGLVRPGTDGGGRVGGTSRVYGLRQNVPAVMLGNGSYDIEGPPIQTISFDRPSDTPFMFIQFVFLENYGNPDYEFTAS